jgi:rhamnosyltransferase
MKNTRQPEPAALVTAPTAVLGTVQDPDVAILLATYNGARYVEQQIRSLGNNSRAFTLHWTDDHSTDSTREIVRSVSVDLGIHLVEHQQNEHQGVPGAFFTLLEIVDSDIYLFCDQDDIWQSAKIDATVANLVPDIALPILCFSDAYVFNEREPHILRRLSQVRGEYSTSMALEESRMFVFNPTMGNTIGFTRPLRDLYCRHKEIARANAAMHDWWMYLIAVACGNSRLLPDVPTTLYRVHGQNVSTVFLSGSGWRLQQAVRRWASRQARGFCLAASTLPQGPRLDRLLALSRLAASLDRRQSPAALLRLARRRALPPVAGWMAWLTIACLCSDANV